MIPLPFRLFWIAGRAGRLEFAILEAICFLAVTGAAVWQAHHGAPGAYLDRPSALAMLVFFAGTTIGAMAAVRRLQDIGADPYLMYWIIVASWAPAVAAQIIGGEIGSLIAPWIMGVALLVAGIVLWKQPSQPQANKYGPSPSASPPGSD
jgi:uncharacterized membrane protein YhaH (DUF805 family)